MKPPAQRQHPKPEPPPAPEPEGERWWLVTRAWRVRADTAVQAMELTKPKYTRGQPITVDARRLVSQVSEPVRLATCVPECRWLETREHAEGCEEQL